MGQWRDDATACLSDTLRQLPRDPVQPPDLDPAPLIRALRKHQVEWILDGSAVLIGLGLDLVPGELDVVPSLVPENLLRLSKVLDDLDAFPEPDATWEHSLSIDEVRRWRPEPAIEANLNHRFITAHGVLDIVPRLTGSSDQLAPKTTESLIGGEPVRAAASEVILRRLERSQRTKDQTRWQQAVDLGLQGKRLGDGC